ncbi:MAG TPA: hypothetical protein VFG69_21145 [Nannocystaceae bacterium]|nr:hypothetical protein [Nannocystaceae bacterium]
MGRSLAGAIAVAVALAWTTPASAKRHKVPQVVAPKRAKAKDVDLSKGGTQRGGLELALGSITAVLTGVLIGRGTWELVNARKLEKDCASGMSTNPDCSPLLGDNPTRSTKIAGGLSLAFAVPMAIATGFLFARGVRVHRAWKAWHARERAVAIVPYASRRGGGVGLTLRF